MAFHDLPWPYMAGECNAFTSHEDTHFFCDVAHGYLRGALDRFAQFFVAPLFTESATERELKAVDAVCHLAARSRDLGNACC